MRCLDLKAYLIGSQRKTVFAFYILNDELFFSVQDFKVLTLLGKGSFACVYRAKSVKTGLEVAIKTVRNPTLSLSLWANNHLSCTSA